MKKKQLLYLKIGENNEDYERKLKRTRIIDPFKNIGFFNTFGNSIDFFGCMKYRKNQKILNYNFSLEKIYFNQLKLEELIHQSQIKDEIIL